MYSQAAKPDDITIPLKILPPPPKPDYNKCKIIDENDRLDCFPQDNTNQQGCEARGCCWIPAKTKPQMNAALAVPYCFYPENFDTYKYVNISETAYGLDAYLKRSYSTAYPGDVEIIKLGVKFESDTRLHIKVRFSNYYLLHRSQKPL